MGRGACTGPNWEASKSANNGRVSSISLSSVIMPVEPSDESWSRLVAPIEIAGVVSQCQRQGREKSGSATTVQSILTTQSVNKALRLIQMIQPLAPFSQSPTSPGAHPNRLDKGAKTPHPTMVPRSMCIVISGPVTTPVPKYPGEVLMVHRPSVAAVWPKTGKSCSIGKRYMIWPYDRRALDVSMTSPIGYYDKEA